MIHFVCAGNTYRSRLAEAYLKSLRIPGVEVMSSGYKADADEDGPICFYTTAVAKQQNISDYLKQNWDQLTQARIDKADIIVAMNRNVFTHVNNQYALPLKTYIWDVADIDYPPLPDNPKTDEEIIAIAGKTFAEIRRHVDELVWFVMRKKPTQLIDVVDERGSPTGDTTTIQEIHERGLWYRGIRVGLYDEAGKVVVQKRSKTIMLRPGKWELGCGGIVNAGESPEVTAVREVKEELGIDITVDDLRLVSMQKENHYLPHYGLHDRCYVYNYVVLLKGKQEFILQISEVEAAKFVRPDEARELLGNGEPLAPEGIFETLLAAMQK